MDYYRNYLIAAAVLTPIFALVAKITARLFDDDVRFLTAIASTFVGYCLLFLSGVIYVNFGPFHWPIQARLLAGACTMLLAHILLLRSPNKERVGFLTAIAVTVAQVAVGFGINYAIRTALAK